jgi:hypothetical protein
VTGAWPEGWLPAVPVMMEAVSAVDFEAVVVVAAEEEEEDWARKPLQRPLLAQVLNAHCESSVQAALKFPQARIVSAVVPQHCAPFLHWLLSEHVWPRSRELAGAETWALMDSARPAKRKAVLNMIAVCLKAVVVEFGEC